MSPKQKHIWRGRLQLRGSMERNLGSCARQLALRGSGTTEASVTRPTSCSRLSLLPPSTGSGRSQARVDSLLPSLRQMVER
jgi:hypothetical protein